jgi:hypothetical protein
MCLRRRGSTAHSLTLTTRSRCFDPGPGRRRLPWMGVAAAVGTPWRARGSLVLARTRSCDALTLVLHGRGGDADVAMRWRVTGRSAPTASATFPSLRLRPSMGSLMYAWLPVTLQATGYSPHVATMQYVFLSQIKEENDILLARCHVDHDNAGGSATLINKVRTSGC